MEIPNDYLFTKEHEWILIDEESALVGITEYAQSALGDITYIELPKLETDVEQFEQIAVVESVKAASDIFSPMSGKIVEVNEKLNDDPGLINRSCYHNGWIAKIQIANADDKSSLMNAQEYEKFLEDLEEKE